MKKICVILSLGFLSACSSIIEGRHQDIMVNTNPPGADCALEREGETLGHINATPGEINIRKTKYDITIRCNRRGYEEATYLDHSGVAGATVGNVLAGGLIGWGFDSATGADNKYDSPVNITMIKK